MSHQKIRMLLIDTDPTRRDDVARYLSQESNLHLDLVAERDEALARLDSTTAYQVLLIGDVVEPPSSTPPQRSLDFLREIKAGHTSIECILFADDPQIEIEALQTGAYHCLPKRPDLKKLAVLIERAARYHRLQAQTTFTQLEKLNRINARINATQNLDDILQIALREGLRAIDANEGSIMLGNPVTNELEIKTWIVNDKLVPAPPDRKFALGEGVAGRVAATGEAYNCVDTAQDEFFITSFTGRPLRSILSVPIVSHGHVLGTINADSIEPASFSENDRQILATLAGHLAVVIKSQMLRDIGRVLSTLTLGEMLTKIVESACILMGSESSAIILIDETSHETIQAARFPLPEEGAFQPRTDGLTSRVVTSGHHLIILDAQNDPRVKETTKQRGIQAVLGVPLKVRDPKSGEQAMQTLGALFVNMKRPAQFGDHDIELLSSLAGQAAVAIQNARRVDEVERLMSSAIDAILAVNEAGRVTRFNRQTKQMLGYTSAELMAKNVTDIYATPAEARRIKQRLLESQNGQVTDLNSFVRHKNGEQIPIQISVALLRDYQGQQAGSVGFFRDQRAMESAQRRIRQLDSLLTASQAINASLDLSSVLDAITSQAMKALSNVDVVVLYLYDHDKEKFYVPPFAKGIAQTAFLVKPVKPKALAHRLMKFGEPFFAEEARTDPLTAGDFVSREKIISLAATPLKVERNTVGVMYFNYRRPHTFTAEEKQIIDILATQAAITIQNAQLYEQAKRRTDALMALYEAGLAVTDSRGIEDTLFSLAEQARRLTGASRSSHLALTEKGRLEYKAAHPTGELTRLQEAVGEITLDQSPRIGVMGRAIQSGQSQLVRDVSQHPDYIEYDSETRSELAVPIKMNGDVIGAIDVEHSELNGFDAEDQQALEALAAQAAIAIDKERLLEETKRRAEALETLHKISLQVTGKHQTSELVKSIVEHAAILLQAHGSALYLLDETGRQARLAAAWKEAEYLADVVVDIDSDSVVGRVIKTNEPFFAADYQNWENRLRNYDDYHFTAVAGAPISWGDRMWGAITVRDTTADRIFDEESLHLLSHLGDLTAVALEHTRRLDDILMGGALDAIIVVNEKDRIVNFNRQAEDLFGYPLEEIQRKTVPELFYDSEEAGDIKKRLNNSQDGRLVARNVLARNKAGEKIPSLFSISMLYDFEGKRAGSVGFFLDRRKIEKAKKRVAQLNRLLDAELGMTMQQAQSDLLKNIVATSMAALGDADAVVLYLYDPDRDTFHIPPTVQGVLKTALVNRPLAPDTAVHRVLQLDGPHFAEAAADDDIMGGDFVNREQIVSSAGMPLKVHDRTIGVMFFNYRQTHRFDEEERHIIRVFARRAALAIDNNRRYRREQQRAKTLSALYHAAQIVNSTLDLPEILDHIAEQAWSLIGLQGAKSHIVSIRLVEGSKIKVAAVHPFKDLSEEKKKLVGSELDLKTGRDERIGIMGRVINTGRPRRVGDVRFDPDYLPFHPETRSELVVPIEFSYQTFGVISIQSAEFDAFDEEDERTLVSLAAQAAIAVQNAQAFGEVKQQAIQQTTISPFVTAGPTTIKMFFGRKKELRTLASPDSHGSYALIGGRRIGKSSLLNRLHQVNLPMGGFRSLYHDFGKTQTYDDFLRATFHSWWPEPPPNSPTTFADLLHSPPMDRPLVLLFDEADKLIPKDRETGWPIFSHLRALINTGQGRIILSGERTLRQALYDAGSPLFNFAKEMLIGPMALPAIRQLITQPMEQMEIELVEREAIVDRIYSFTSGHPNIVQRLCDRLIDRLLEQPDRQISLADVEAVINDQQFQQLDFLSTYWEAASPLEKIISLLMAADETVRTLAAIRQALRDRCGLTPKAPDIDYALQSLIDLRSILRREQDGYDFAVTAFPKVVARVLTLDDMLEVLAEDYDEQRKNKSYGSV